MDFVWEAVKESLIMFPFLFGAYVLVELIEFLTSKKLNGNVLKSRVAPLVGAGVGLLPQCGFGVVASDLYSKRKITMGTLLAIFFATSDEAVPLLIISPEKAIYLLPLLAIKFVFGFSLGFIVDAIVNRKRVPVVHGDCHAAGAPRNDNENKDEPPLSQGDNPPPSGRSEHGDCHAADAPCNDNENKDEHPLSQGDNPPQSGRSAADAPRNDSVHGDCHVAGAPRNDSVHEEGHHVGCCGHHIEEEENEPWAKRYLLHPALHSLKVFAFVLIVNLVLGGLIALIGENELMAFLNSARYVTPVLAVLVGLIPNCAASEVLTLLFISGGLSFGACVAGLCANAGIAMVVLFKQNKNMKENLTIFGVLSGVSLVVGYLVTIIMDLI